MIVLSHKYLLNLLTVFNGLPLLQLLHVRLTSKPLFVELFCSQSIIVMNAFCPLLTYNLITTIFVRGARIPHLIVLETNIKMYVCRWYN